MKLVIPDVDKIIDNPSMAEIRDALLQLKEGLEEDDCIDIDKSPKEFLQAIGSNLKGFKLRYREEQPSRIYESRTLLSTPEVTRIIEQYLLENNEWKSTIDVIEIEFEFKASFLERIKKKFKIVQPVNLGYRDNAR
ncbi:hypothetical protein P4C99_02780 [Pontiellaceae bacterium B1224]|nr:hypothetical protein [Pontiellaceae bacterium B1224]